jgi:hypothetical protein
MKRRPPHHQCRCRSWIQETPSSWPCPCCCLKDCCCLATDCPPKLSTLPFCTFQPIPRPPQPCDCNPFRCCPCHPAPPPLSAPSLLSCSSSFLPLLLLLSSSTNLALLPSSPIPLFSPTFPPSLVTPILTIIIIESLLVLLMSKELTSEMQRRSRTIWGG